MKIKLYGDVISNTFTNNNENLETFRYSTTEGQLLGYIPPEWTVTKTAVTQTTQHGKRLLIIRLGD